ncbi:hypothetical protein CJD36_022620 [Flavipsychrobacter stenotrophus]|uniref:Uncharacterized protein n=2 Tax=Flavipsychrobacter stenotrophus TaxID=2077091 RepID=A0A2S7SPE0_9BACT|nr:hypothetical protein CJD36_022620 [Flavipsychrobacter stenotrophus]
MMPFWFLIAFQQSAKAMSIEMVFDMLLPIYLLKSNYNNSEEFMQFKYYPINAFIIMCAVATSCFMYYLNWAVSIGSLLHPDPETLAATPSEFFAASTIALIGIVISFISIFLKKRRGLADTE